MKENVKPNQYVIKLGQLNYNLETTNVVFVITIIMKIFVFF